MTKFKTWSDYCYPNSDVLKNLHDIRDAGKLHQLEEEAARARTAESLYLAPIDGNFDRAHMKSIHRRLFGDTYEWAGQERVGPTRGAMVKPGPSPESILSGDYKAQDGYGHQYFPACEEMGKHFDHYCAYLNREDLRDASSEEFVSAIAEPWAEINSAHLFREGNTRTQVVFFTYFARHHGHDLDFGRFSTDREFRLKFNAGRFLAQSKVDYSLLAQALTEVIDAPEAGANQSETDTPDDYEPMYSEDEYAEKYEAEPQLGVPERRQRERRTREKDAGVPTDNGGRFA